MLVPTDSKRNANLILVGLSALRKLLEIVRDQRKQQKKMNLKRKNLTDSKLGFKAHFENLGGLDLLENLQTHPSRQVYNEAY